MSSTAEIDKSPALRYNDNKQKMKEGSVMTKSAKKRVSNCETCMYYDYDDDYEAYICTANLDEDDLERFVKGANTYCPYYRFYDEYKSVQKQN